MTIDLKTGLDYPPRREDYITKITAVRAGGECPLWHEFLRRVTDEDLDLQHYLQRMAGYCLTGWVHEHVLFFLYGTGGNGKGLFLNTLTAIWNDYAVVAPMDMLMETRQHRHETELAFLRGARLVVAQETEKNHHWAESKIAALTGGDPITARYMRQVFFTFKPQFKLVIAGNHKPSLRSVNAAMRRRIHLVPFVITIPENERDKQLFEKLKPQWGGIFQWAVDGCLEYQKIGLAPPKAVTDASKAYFAEEDAIGKWIEERCVEGGSYLEAVSTLFKNWATWAEAAHEFVGA
jgi:putative DNA primase/helicase